MILCPALDSDGLSTGLTYYLMHTHPPQESEVLLFWHSTIAAAPCQHAHDERKHVPGNRFQYPSLEHTNNMSRIALHSSVDVP